MWGIHLPSHFQAPHGIYLSVGVIHSYMERGVDKGLMHNRLEWINPWANQTEFRVHTGALITKLVDWGNPVLDVSHHCRTIPATLARPFLANLYLLVRIPFTSLPPWFPPTGCLMCWRNKANPSLNVARFGGAAIREKQFQITSSEYSVKNVSKKMRKCITTLAVITLGSVKSTALRTAKDNEYDPIMWARNLARLADRRNSIVSSCLKWSQRQYCEN